MYIYVFVAAQTVVHSGLMIYFYKGTLINLAKKDNLHGIHCVPAFRQDFFKYPISLNYCSNEHFVHPKSPKNFGGTGDQDNEFQLYYCGVAVQSDGASFTVEPWGGLVVEEMADFLSENYPLSKKATAHPLKIDGWSLILSFGETVYFQGLKC